MKLNILFLIIVATMLISLTIAHAKDEHKTKYKFRKISHDELKKDLSHSSKKKVRHTYRDAFGYKTTATPLNGVLIDQIEEFADKYVVAGSAVVGREEKEFRVSIKKTLVNGLKVQGGAGIKAQATLTKLSAEVSIAVACQFEASIGKIINLGVAADAVVIVSAGISKGMVTLQAGAVARAAAYTSSDYGGIGIEATAGISGKFNVGLQDGCIKFDVGATLGVGTAVKFDINIQEMSKDFVKSNFASFFSDDIPNFFTKTLCLWCDK
jgi:hypothetical protein